MAELLHQIDYECQDLFEAEKNASVVPNLEMEDEDEDGEMVVVTKFGQKGERLQEGSSLRGQWFWSPSEGAMGIRQ